ncbi:hypothetical protein NDU88_010890 [Pleurodeles waltl]|uniref:Myb/SANT-like DNA-binding domain-containing protein n=1 Tax=Pleurodeles waltl TaxID=8319 RepID=A0AAV7Q392_PLEWA|nr:hypothetical protein NDU88_010890 [Pleurodeles waltl]
MDTVVVCKYIDSDRKLRALADEVIKHHGVVLQHWLKTTLLKTRNRIWEEIMEKVNVGSFYSGDIEKVKQMKASKGYCTV